MVVGVGYVCLDNRGIVLVFSRFGRAFSTATKLLAAGKSISRDVLDPGTLWYEIYN